MNVKPLTYEQEVTLISVLLSRMEHQLTQLLEHVTQELDIMDQAIIQLRKELTL